jgi:acetyltransferase-like isoleucine patch superfamily enzyme/acyl carrier protein
MTDLLSKAGTSERPETLAPGDPIVRALRRQWDRARADVLFAKQASHPRLAAANLVSQLLPIYSSGDVRARLYRWAGFSVGEAAAVLGTLSLRGADANFYKNLTVGAGSCIGDHVTINLDAPVTLGRNVVLSPQVVIYTATHAVGPGYGRAAEMQALSVTVEDGAWIRLGAIVAPGVTVGRGSIVAAGAVVLSDVPANSYVEGNPARVIRELPWADHRNPAENQLGRDTPDVLPTSGRDRLESLVASVLDVRVEDVYESTCPANTPTWDSMAHLALIAAVEETYSVSVSAAEERAMLSVDDLRKLLCVKGVDA